jgi:hypothetical protein
MNIYWKQETHLKWHGKVQEVDMNNPEDNLIKIAIRNSS